MAFGYASFVDPYKDIDKTAFFVFIIKSNKLVIHQERQGIIVTSDRHSLHWSENNPLKNELAYIFVD